MNKPIRKPFRIALATIAIIIGIASPVLAGDDAISKARTSCTNKWPTDFRMQKYCLDKQKTSIQELAELFDQYSQGTVERDIVIRCRDKWAAEPGTEDYKMVLYCTNQQMEAYQALDSGSTPKADRPTPTSANDTSPTIGEALYHGKGVCKSCHGYGGDPSNLPIATGDQLKRMHPKPTDIRTSTDIQKKTDQDIFQIIKLGSPGTAMIAMDHVNDEEIWHIISYIRTINRP